MGSASGLTLAAISGATASLLEAVRGWQAVGTRVFVAASGAMFGAAPESPQRRGHPMPARDGRTRPPSSPRTRSSASCAHTTACSRAPGSSTTTSQSTSPDHFVSTQDHPLRPPRSSWVSPTTLLLGDLSAVRDWSFAGDLMHGVWLMLQQGGPRRLRPGQRRRPHRRGARRDRVRTRWTDRRGLHTGRSRGLVRAARDDRPGFGDRLGRARERLGWRPTLSFEQLIRRMVDADLRTLECQIPLP